MVAYQPASITSKKYVISMIYIIKKVAFRQAVLNSIQHANLLKKLLISVNTFI